MKLLTVIIWCMLNVVNYGRSSPIPETILATAGSEVVLPCPAPGNGTVLWQFDQLTSSLPREIYVDKGFINGNKKRCRLTGSVSSFNDLVISNVKTTDAGGYICIETNGIGQSHYIILKVEGGDNTVGESTALSDLLRTVTTFSGTENVDTASNESSSSDDHRLAVVAIPICFVVLIALIAMVILVLRRKRSDKGLCALLPSPQMGRLKLQSIQQKDDILSQLPIAVLDVLTIKSAQGLFLNIRTKSTNAALQSVNTIAAVNNACRKAMKRSKRKVAKNFDCLNQPFPGPLSDSVKLELPGTNSEVSCFTKYCDYIFIIRGRSKELLILGKASKDGSYTLQQKFPLDQTMDPLALTANCSHQCLFVCDRRNKCVWKINASQENRSWNLDIQKWLDTNEVTTSVLSYDSNVVLLRVSEPLARKECQGWIDIFNMDANLLRRTPLPTDVKSPTCVAYTNRDTYLVSFVGGVSEIDKNGKEVIRYASGISFPVHIKADSQRESAFVVDVETGKIWQINNKLRVKLLVLQLPTKQVLNFETQDVSPMRVYCDDKKNELLVGLENGEIRLYSREHHDSNNHSYTLVRLHSVE